LSSAREEALRKQVEPYRESLRNLVLRILAERPRHGYEIIKRIEEVTGGRWKPAAGTLYPLLDQMKEEGLIEVERVEVEGVKGGKRVVYRLSESGWQRLIEVTYSRVKPKIDFIVYYFAELCYILRQRGMESQSEVLCRELEDGVRRLEDAVKRFCR